MAREEGFRTMMVLLGTDSEAIALDFFSAARAVPLTVPRVTR